MTELKQEKKAVWYGAIIACAIVGLASAAWFGEEWRSADAPAPEPEAHPAGEKVAGTEPAPSPEAAVETAAATPDAPDEAPAEAAVAPSLDLVRLEQNGDALVAGRAEPGARVQIIVDGAAVADAVADASGNFAVFIEITETGKPLVLWLSTTAEGGGETVSEQQVILTPAPELVASAAPEDPSAAPESPAAPEQSDGPAQAEPEVAAATAPPADEAPPAEQDPPSGNTELAMAGATGPAVAQPGAVLVSDDSGVGLMSPAPLADAGEIRIDTITYGADDLVELRGRSGSEGQIRLSLDGAPVAVTQTDAEGGWQADLRSVPAGTYTLRAERLDDKGAVIASATVPFRREAPEQVARAAAQGGLAQVVTVQPGFTLWGIARDRYGSGIRYVQVFEANKMQIDDPDLIYPGQVFDLPSEISAD